MNRHEPQHFFVTENYLNTYEKDSITPERIRLAIIGAIRYGKQVVIGKS